MATTRSMVRVGQGPSRPKTPKEVLKRVREAAKYPIVYTEDCPPSTPEALKEFAHLAVEQPPGKGPGGFSLGPCPAANR